MKLLIIVFLMTSSILAFSQSNKDTISLDLSKSETYYTDYSDLLAIRLYTLFKFYALSISDEENTLVLRPNSPTSIGIGLNYKGIGLSLGFGIPTSKASKEKYVDTKRLDLQISIIGNKIAGDGFLQLYKGYYNSNPNDIIEWPQPHFPKVGDLQIISMGLTGSYIFNSKKFSYKAAFQRNQIQEKSAGSFTTGLFVYYDQAASDNGFIPKEFPDSIRQDINLKAFRTIIVGASAGYMYTFVISKAFFLNLAAIPGVGYRWLGVKNLANEKDEKHEIAPQLFGRIAIGYENKHFYLGLTASSILRNFELRQFTYDLETEQIRLFIGKRFHVSGK